jgi:hypothetical protein
MSPAPFAAPSHEKGAGVHGKVGSSVWFGLRHENPLIKMARSLRGRRKSAGRASGCDLDVVSRPRGIALSGYVVRDAMTAKMVAFNVRRSDHRVDDGLRTIGPFVASTPATPLTVV